MHQFKCFTSNTLSLGDTFYVSTGTNGLPNGLPFKLTVLSIGKCNIGNALIIRNKERHYKCKTPTLYAWDMPPLGGNMLLGSAIDGVF